MSAGAALETNICAEAGDIPFITATGMGFAQANNIIELQIWKHNETTLEAGMKGLYRTRAGPPKLGAAKPHRSRENPGSVTGGQIASCVGFRPFLPKFQAFLRGRM